MPYRSPARVLAPLALAACVVALVIVLISAGGKSEPKPTAPARSTEPTSTGERAARTYRVKPGDSLSAIADEQNVPVADIIRLNPDLDPQALQTGQRIRLRR